VQNSQKNIFAKILTLNFVPVSTEYYQQNQIRHKNRIQFALQTGSIAENFATTKREFKFSMSMQTGACSVMTDMKRACRRLCFYLFQAANCEGAAPQSIYF
jgi:hypothetical protein